MGTAENHTRTSEDGGSGFGLLRMVLLVGFVLMSGLTYVYVDTSRLGAFLLMVQNDPGGTMHVFLLFYTLGVVVLFPCMILQVVSGALYGFWLGLLVSWLATSVGQCLAFLLGRYLFRQAVKSYLHDKWPSFPAIDAAMRQEGWKLVCLLRLSPVLPYNILNYALALTPVGFATFSIASAISTIPWTALYVYVGTFSTDLMALASGKISTGGNNPVLRTVLLSGLVIFTAVYGYIWSRRAINAVLKDVTKHDLEMRAADGRRISGNFGIANGDEEMPLSGSSTRTPHSLLRKSLSPTSSVHQEAFPLLKMTSDRHGA